MTAIETKVSAAEVAASSLSLECDAKDLAREVVAAVAAAEKKTTVPILGHVLLWADSADRLTVRATDLEIMISGSIAARVKSPGAIALPADRLAAYLRLAPAGDMKIDIGANGSATLAIGRSKTRLAGMSSSSFPDSPEAGGLTAKIKLSDLAGMIREVIFSISSEESRFTLNGALFEIENGLLVGTDSHRMAVTRRDFELVKATEKKIILPKKAMALLAKLSEAGDYVASVFVGERGLTFELGGRTLYVQLLGGNFPDWRRVMPSKPPATKVTVSIAEFLGALARVRTTADERSRAFKLSAASDGLTLESAMLDLGESSEWVAAVLDGDPVTVGLNADYVREALAAATGDKVEIRIHANGGAVEFGANGSADYRCIVMPMRI